MSWTVETPRDPGECSVGGCPTEARVADIVIWTSGPATGRFTVTGFCDEHAWHKPPGAPEYFVWRNEGAGSAAVRPLNAQTIEKALRSEPADENMLRDIAAGLIDSYASMMRWAQAARDAAVPNDWVPVYDALAEFADCSIRKIRAFVAECSLQSTNLASAMRSGLPLPPVKLTLTLDIDDAAMSHIRTALAAIRSQR